MASITTAGIPQNVVIAMAGIAKVFVGEVVETGMFFLFVFTCLRHPIARPHGRAMGCLLQTTL